MSRQSRNFRLLRSGHHYLPRPIYGHFSSIGRIAECVDTRDIPCVSGLTDAIHGRCRATAVTNLGHCYGVSTERFAADNTVTIAICSNDCEVGEPVFVLDCVRRRPAKTEYPWSAIADCDTRTFACPCLDQRTTI